MKIEKLIVVKASFAHGTPGMWCASGMSCGERGERQQNAQGDGGQALHAWRLPDDAREHLAGDAARPRR